MNILLLSDDRNRSDLLVRDFAGLGNWIFFDLWDDEILHLVRPDLIVADVHAAGSDTILRLRRCLATVKRKSLPLLWLLHGSSARSRIQASALEADHVLEYERLGLTLPAIVENLDSAARKAIAESMASEARAFLVRMFSDTATLTPPQLEVGAAIVARAIAETNIGDWLRVVWRFDNVTHQHCLLVAGLAAAFARSIGMNERDAGRLTKAALLHDVGKVAVPIAILNKPAALTKEEMMVMRTHAAHGHTMLQDCGFETEMLQVVRSHHEMLDGSGYPDGLSGSQIPDLVRLVTICDIYAALIEHRPYRVPMSMGRAYEILTDMAGRLDADLVRAFAPIARAFTPSSSVPNSIVHRPK